MPRDPRSIRSKRASHELEKTSIAVTQFPRGGLRGYLKLSESNVQPRFNDHNCYQQNRVPINYPDFLFPFLFFRTPPTLLQSATSAMSRARFACRPSNCAVGDPVTTDTGRVTAVGLASGKCSPDDLDSMPSPSSAGSTEMSGMTNFGSENTARYVLRVSGNSPSYSQQASKYERSGNTHAHEGREIWVC